MGGSGVSNPLTAWRGLECSVMAVAGFSQAICRSCQNEYFLVFKKSG